MDNFYGTGNGSETVNSPLDDQQLYFPEASPQGTNHLEDITLARPWSPSEQYSLFDDQPVTSCPYWNGQLDPAVWNSSCAAPDPNHGFAPPTDQMTPFDNASSTDPWYPEAFPLPMPWNAPTDTSLQEYHMGPPIQMMLETTVAQADHLHPSNEGLSSPTIDAETEKRCRNYRRFDKHQVSEMRKEFDLERNPSLENRIKLAERIGLKPDQVREWFRQERSRQEKLEKAVSSTSSTGNLDLTAPQTTSDSQSNPEVAVPKPTGNPMPTTVQRRIEKNGPIDHRKRFTTNQIAELCEAFAQNRLPNRNAKRKLGNKIGLTELQVQEWFNKKRNRKKVSRASSNTVDSSIAPETPSMTSSDALSGSSPMNPGYPEEYFPQQMMSPIPTTSASGNVPMERVSDEALTENQMTPEAHEKNAVHKNNEDHLETGNTRPKIQRFKSYQIEGLKKAFEMETLDGKTTRRTEVAAELDLTLSQVTNWFRERRHRIRHGGYSRQFSPYQLTELCKAFEQATHPSRPTKTELAEQLGLTPLQVENWFHNKRVREKKLGLAGKEGR